MAAEVAQGDFEKAAEEDGGDEWGSKEPWRILAVWAESFLMARSC